MQEKKENFLVKYVRDAFMELTHVTWPTKHQAVNLSILVVCFVFVAALAIAGLDFVFNQGYLYLLNLR